MVNDYVFSLDSAYTHMITSDHTLRYGPTSNYRKCQTEYSFEVLIITTKDNYICVARRAPGSASGN